MATLQPLQEAHAVCPGHGRTALKPPNGGRGEERCFHPEHQISIKAIKVRLIVSASYTNTPGGSLALNSRDLIHRAP